MTIGAILGMAAHIEGKGCGSVDMAGLAQKGGTVYSHIKIAAKPEEIHAISISAGGADLVLGCDLVVSGTAKVLAAIRPRETGVVVNTAEIYPGDFTRNADFTLPSERIEQAIRQAAGDGAAFCDADRDRDRAARQFDCRQYASSGLCLAARPRAARRRRRFSPRSSSTAKRSR